jgi:hypothetical protein
MSELFYLQDSRSCVGDRMMWWAIDGKGYTSNLGEAEKYSFEDAQQRNRRRETDIPWPVTYIDSSAEVSVDHQYLSQEEAAPLLVSGCMCVIQIGKQWNGNDILFSGWGSVTTYNYDAAWKTSLAQAEDVVRDTDGAPRIIWPLSYINTKARKVCPIINVHPQAIAKAGIKLAKLPKQKRMRDVYNCGGCGRFISGNGRYFSDCHHCGADNRP